MLHRPVETAQLVGNFASVPKLTLCGTLAASLLHPSGQRYRVEDVTVSRGSHSRNLPGSHPGAQRVSGGAQQCDGLGRGEHRLVAAQIGDEAGALVRFHVG